MMSKRVIFFGTPKIAVSCLKALLDENINVVAVVTKVDKLTGRRQEIQKSEVKIFAQKHQITVLQPEKVNDIYDQLISLKPDLFVVCAYGKLIGEKILNIPKYHCINIHTSLLPRWRGGAPIHYAVLSGDKESGVSLMYMTKELDAGNVIYQQSITLDINETYCSLYGKLSNLSYRVLRTKIHSLFDTNVQSLAQDSVKVTIARNISREDERINWSKKSIQIDRQIRGLFDKPIAYTVYDNMNIKIHEAHVITDFTDNQPGEIIDITKSGIKVVCGEKTIINITKLQLPGKKAVLVKEMINGNHLFKLNGRFTY